MISVPQFLSESVWQNAVMEPITGDASTRRYFRLRSGGQSAVLMDASRALETVPPFVRINRHLASLGFSVPKILAGDEPAGFLLLEDFGDETFARILERGRPARELQHAGGPPALREEEVFGLATDVLVALHKRSNAVPSGLRTYDPDTMLADAELYLQIHEITEQERADFQGIWREILPLAHAAPASLLLRDYHVANLMWLPDRAGNQRAGLLDFQDAYAGPVTYDLISLLEDARRDLPRGLKEKMIARYLEEFPGVDRDVFETSWAILAALRHTRVLAVFEKLGREGKPDYKKRHSPRVERMLQAALRHPKLAGMKQWFIRYAR